MHPAKFKILHESLGLSAQWLSDQLGVPLRTVQNWAAGRERIPQEVPAILKIASQHIEKSVADTLGLIVIDAAQHGKPESVSLIRYRTTADWWQFQPTMQPYQVSAHAVILERIQQGLVSMGIRVRIVYMEPSAYRAWLQDRDYKDAELRRYQWAASAIPNTRDR